MNPSPSSPKRFSTGTRQSLKWSATVGEPRMPILRSFLPTAKPGRPGSIRNAVTPFALRAGSTVAKTVSTPAWSPFEHHCLAPFRR